MCRISRALAFKGDDALKTSFFAETTSKIMVLTSDGKVFTLDARNFPAGGLTGEPIRLMADIEEGGEIVASGRTPRARRC